PAQFRGFVDAHVKPCARIELGLQLSADPQVHCLIDLSDGIAKECATLCYDNSFGMILNPPPEYSSLFADLAQICGVHRHEWFLYGGEDYELLFTAGKDFNPESFSDGLVTLYRIGVVTTETNTVLYTTDDGQHVAIEQKGWDHCAR
ncbi:MAG: hypothetical protein JW795_11815, partial [Chitinivibrionales bacterium]|nr:hypothetical protein [Chitinivibrionales bacterium]